MCYSLYLQAVSPFMWYWQCFTKLCVEVIGRSWKGSPTPKGLQIYPKPNIVIISPWILLRFMKLHTLDLKCTVQEFLIFSNKSWDV
jgi:hypothetical protein